MRRDPLKRSADTVRTPLHERIREEIERRIVSGRWPPGHRIPYEHELTAEFGCARMTVNKALSALSGRGLIRRRRRAGSFVAMPEIEHTIVEIHDLQREAEREGRPYRFQLLTRRVERIAPAEAARLSVAPGAEALFLECRHDIASRPVALERRLIMLDQVPEARTESFAEVPPGSWLLRRVPWTEVEHVIRSIEADRDIARHLKVARGSACLVLDRHTWMSGAPVTKVRLIHPGDCYHFIGRFKPTSG